MSVQPRRARHGAGNCSSNSIWGGREAAVMGGVSGVAATVNPPLRRKRTPVALAAQADISSGQRLIETTLPGTTSQWSPVVDAEVGVITVSCKSH